MADEEEKAVEADSQKDAEAEGVPNVSEGQVSNSDEEVSATKEESNIETGSESSFDSDLEESDLAEGDDEVKDKDLDSRASEVRSPEDITEVVMTGAEVINQLEGLIPTALDAAEASTNASEASLSTMRRLSLTQTELDGRLERNNLLFARQSNQIKLILAAVSSVLAVAVMVFIFMIIQLSSRVSEVDALLMAVTKRVVKMNQSLELFEDLQFDIRILAEKQANATIK